MGINFAVGWRQVAAAFVLVGTCGIITATYGILAVPLGEEFRPSRMVLMLAMTVTAVVTGVLAPVLGSLMDRLPLRGLMLLGAVLLGAGYAALSYVTSFVQVLIVFGLVLAPVNVLLGPMAITVLLSRWFVKRRGTAIGVAITGLGVGGVLFPPLIQWLFDTYEWRMGLRLFAGIVLALCVTAAALVVDSPARRGLFPDGAEADPEPVRPAQASARDGSISAILRDPAFWLVGLLFALAISGVKGVITNLVPMAVDQGIAASDAALLLSVYAGFGFFSKLGFAAVADKVGPRSLTLFGFAGFACGMACLSQAASGYWLIMVGVALTGFFGGLMVPLKSFLVPRIFGRHVVGRTMGLLSTISLCASLATPPLFGLIFDLTGSYSAINLVFALLVGGAVLIIPYVRMQAKDGAGAPSHA